MSPITKNIFETIKKVKAFRYQKDVRTVELDFIIPANNIWRMASGRCLLNLTQHTILGWIVHGTAKFPHL